MALLIIVHVNSCYLTISPSSLNCPLRTLDGSGQATNIREIKSDGLNQRAVQLEEEFGKCGPRFSGYGDAEEGDYSGHS